jgi:urease accessory protein
LNCSSSKRGSSEFVALSGGKPSGAGEPEPSPNLQRAAGVGRVVGYQRAGQTCLAELYQDGCAKIRLPNTHDQTLQAVLINTAGGLTGGDRMDWAAAVPPGGNMVMTTQACERVYRSIGGAAQVRTALTVGTGAHLDWLPQETILFEDSQLDRRIDIDLAEGASLTAVEAVLLGRDAMGEKAERATLRDTWRVRRNGRLLHAEATRLTGDALARHSAALLGGKRGFATILHVGATPDHLQGKLDLVRSLMADDSHIAASAVGARLVVRALAPSGLALRRLIVPILAALSGAGTLPRLWDL